VTGSDKMARESGLLFLACACEAGDVAYANVSHASYFLGACRTCAFTLHWAIGRVACRAGSSLGTRGVRPHSRSSSLQSGPCLGV
jgi:hypothetical protein